METNVLRKSPRAPKLLVGVGNVLRRDDSVGVRVAQIMAKLPLPPEVEVYEAGTVGMDAAWVLEQRELVVVIDAIDAGAKPGTVYRLAPDELRPVSAPTPLSLHDAHLLDAIDQVRLIGTAPTEIVVLAVQVADVSDGVGLTPAVERSLERVILRAIEALGLPPPIEVNHAIYESVAL